MRKGREEKRDGRVRGEREARGDAGRRRTDAPRDKFMNFMGIWGSCRARDYGTPISRSVPYGSSLWRGSAFYTALGIIPPMVIIYAGDIIRGLDS